VLGDAVPEKCRGRQKIAHPWSFSLKLMRSFSMTNGRFCTIV
jgi:hypothetical protein